MDIKSLSISQKADLRKYILSNNLFSKDTDENFKYRPNENRKNDMNYVKKNFRFIRQEPAYEKIIEHLAFSYGISLYDCATMILALSVSINHSFNMLSAPIIDGHFSPIYRELSFMQNKGHRDCLEIIMEEVCISVENNDSESYFSLYDKAKKMGREMLKKFYVINRMKKIGL